MSLLCCSSSLSSLKLSISLQAMLQYSLEKYTLKKKCGELLLTGIFSGTYWEFLKLVSPPKQLTKLPFNKYFANVVTESQVWRHPWRLFVQPPCSSQAQLHQAAQDLSSWALKTSRDGASATSLDNLFLCSVTLMVEITEKTLASSSLFLPTKCLHVLANQVHMEKPALFLPPHFLFPLILASVGEADSSFRELPGESCS